MTNDIDPLAAPRAEARAAMLAAHLRVRRLYSQGFTSRDVSLQRARLDSARAESTYSRWMRTR